MNKNSKDLEKVIEYQGREFTLGLVTKDFIFYIDEKESDENGCCIMYRNNKDMELVSDNYFAYGGYMDELGEINEGKQCLFETEDTKEYRLKLKKEKEEEENWNL